jgi:hypothetical protein
LQKSRQNRGKLALICGLGMVIAKVVVRGPMGQRNKIFSKEPDMLRPKFCLESLERRTVLANDFAAMLMTDASLGADADVNTDYMAVSTAADVNADVDASGAGADVIANVDADLNANIDLPVDDVTGAVNDLTDTVSGVADDLTSGIGDTITHATDNVGDAVDHAVGDVQDTASNLLGNIGNTTNGLLGNVNQLTDDVLNDLGGTADDLVDDVTSTASGLNLPGISDIIDDVEDSTLVSDLVDDLASTGGLDHLVDSLNLGNIPDDLTVSDLGNSVNGLLHSGGANVNGFLHSLPNRLTHVADALPVSQSTGALSALDNIFSNIGHRGLLR